MSFNIEKAIKLGIPLFNNKETLKIKGDKTLLSIEAKKWIPLLAQNILSQRESEAIMAFIIALKDHYQSFYKNYIECDFYEDQIPHYRKKGRVIKLRRIATANLSGYL
jgi:hypothetical protein